MVKNNVIIDNRIVNDITFATRFSNFLKDIQVNDPMSEEELEYMRRIAKLLLFQQINSATDESEVKYLRNCHKID